LKKRPFASDRARGRKKKKRGSYILAERDAYLYFKPTYTGAEGKKRGGEDRCIALL